jgi:hypothetical protein
VNWQGKRVLVTGVGGFFGWTPTINLETDLHHAIVSYQ